VKSDNRRIEVLAKWAEAAMVLPLFAFGGCCRWLAFVAEGGLAQGFGMIHPGASGGNGGDGTQPDETVVARSVYLGMFRFQAVT
jgi:hypothetical protein